MRTVVQVWVPVENQSLPSSLTEALGLAARVARADPSRGERLLALRVALLDRYPLVPGADGEPSVWADDALALERPGPSWDIAIAPAAAYVVRPYVIALAGRFGLDACDRATGEVWLASGDVYSRDDRGPCVAALAAWRQGDCMAAHDALCELAQAGNATALWHLGTLYDEGGGFVQCNALIACALFGQAIAGQDAAAAPASGAAAPAGESGAPSSRDPAEPAAARDHASHGARRTFDRVSFTHAYRERIGPEMRAAADELQATLREPGAIRRTLREAGGPRDMEFAAAMEALARGDVAIALNGLMPLAEQGHVDAQRTVVRLWASGEAAPADARRELDWTRVAAQAGDDAGMAALAALFDEGVLLPRDPAQTAHWLRRLVRRGRTAAVRDAARERLAHLERGAGVVRRSAAAPGAAPTATDDAITAQRSRDAVRRREPQALVRLGRSLAFGYDEHRDRVAAQALFVLAGRLGAERVPFLAPEQADPRAVRHLLALIGERGDPLALVEARQGALDDDEDGDSDGGPGDDGAVVLRTRGPQVRAGAAVQSAASEGPAPMPALRDAASRPAGLADVAAPARPDPASPPAPTAPAAFAAKAESIVSSVETSARLAAETARAGVAEEAAPAGFAEEAAREGFAEEAAPAGFAEEAAPAGFAEEAAPTGFADETAPADLAPVPARVDFAPAAAPVDFAPATVPVPLAVFMPRAPATPPGPLSAGVPAVAPEREVLAGLRAAFEQPPLTGDEQRVALRRAAVALTGGILLVALGALCLVAFGGLVTVALWLLAGACACRAAVQAARIAGDSAAVARLVAFVAFVPVAGQVLAVWLMHRAGRALRSRLPPSQRAARGGPGRSRQRLRSRAARAGARSRMRS